MHLCKEFLNFRLMNIEHIKHIKATFFESLYKATTAMCKAQDEHMIAINNYHLNPCFETHDIVEEKEKMVVTARKELDNVLNTINKFDLITPQQFENFLKADGWEKFESVNEGVLDYRKNNKQITFLSDSVTFKMVLYRFLLKDKSSLVEIVMQMVKC